MICIVDDNNKVINIVNTPSPSTDNEREYHPWNELWKEYTDVEPPGYANQREAADMKSKLKQKALDSMMLILNGSSEVSALQKEYQAELDSVTNDVALHMVEMFPVWNPNGVTYKKGKRISYNGVLYEVVKEHVSQENWKPDITPSEYAKVISSISGEIPEWEQPLPTNAYKLGDRVKHNGRYYESTYDGANVWEPGVVGEEYWKDITDEIGEAS